MRTIKYSIGRKIAIAMCVVIALTLGIVGAVFAHLSSFSATAYTSINVTTSLAELEEGLNELDDTVWNQLKPYLTVTADGETTLGADDYTITGIKYSGSGDNATATITVKAGDVEYTTAPIKAVAAVFGGVSVEVDTTKAAKATLNESGTTWVPSDDGVWKVKSGNLITAESVFLTDTAKRPVQTGEKSILSFLNVSLQYQHVKVPVNTDDTTPVSLGAVYEYRIRQKSFTAGNQNIEVSVTFPDNGSTIGRVGTFSAAFEDVKVVRLEVSPKTNVDIASYTDVSDAITVIGYYNDGRTAKELDSNQYHTSSSLLPTSTQTGTNYEETIGKGADTIVNKHSSFRGNDVPDSLLGGSTYSVDVLVSCDGVTATTTVPNVKHANPYQIIGIYGTLGQQTVDKKLDVTGLTVSISYVEQYEDIIPTTSGPAKDCVGSTLIEKLHIVDVPLEAVSANVEVSIDNVEAGSLSAATVSKGTHTYQLTYTYKGTMFYFATLQKNQTLWMHNDRFVTQSYTVTGAENTALEDTNYFPKPVLDEDDVGYSVGLTKRILNVDFTDPAAIADGTVIEISNGEASLKFTYNHVTTGGVVSVVPVPDVNNLSASVGVTYSAESGIITINRPGDYSVTVTMPELGANGWRNYYTNTEERIVTYNFRVEKGELAVNYTNVTMSIIGTESKIEVPMGSLVSTLQDMDVLFSAGGNIVHDYAPTDYALYIRKTDDTAWHVFKVGTTGTAQVDTDYFNRLSSEDKNGATFQICVAYGDTAFYNGNNTYQLPVTLQVARPNIFNIHEDNVVYNRGTAEAIIEKWEAAVSDVYTVKVLYEDREEVAAGEVLHAGNYYIVFYENGSRVHSISFTVSPINYFKPDAVESGEEYKFGSVDTDTLFTFAKKPVGAYYELAGKDNVTFRNESGYTTNDASSLTVGRWTASFDTKYDDSDDSEDAEGDYILNNVTIDVIFEVAQATLTLSVDENDSDFNSGSFTEKYNAEEFKFVLSGLTPAIKSEVTVRVTATTHDGKTIINGVYTLETSDEAITLTVKTAGTYTLTITTTDNLTLGEGVSDVYTVTVERAEVKVQSSHSVSIADCGDINNIAKAITLEQKEANHGLYIKEFSLYTDEGASTEAELPLHADTYYLKVNSIGSNAFVPSLENTFSATFSYDVNYYLPDNLIVEVTITRSSVEALIPVTNGGLVSDNDGYSLTLDYGTQLNVLGLFTNAVNKDVYIIELTDSDGNKVDDYTKLENGTLDVGNYSAKISVDNNNVAWVEGASDFIFAVTVNQKTLIYPQVAQAQNITYNGSEQSIPVATTNGINWSEYKGKVTATAMGGASFDFDNGTLSVTDAGTYNISFTIDGTNYSWDDEGEAQIVVVVDKMAITLPELGTQRTVTTNEGEAEEISDDTITYGDFTLTFTVSDGRFEDGTLKTVFGEYDIVYTITAVEKDGESIDVDNFVWAENTQDTLDRAYVSAYSKGEFTTSATLISKIVERLLDLSVNNTSVEYGTDITADDIFTLGGDDKDNVTTATIVLGTSATKAEGGSVAIADSDKWDVGVYIVPVKLTNITVGDYSYSDMSFNVTVQVYAQSVTVTISGSNVYGESVQPEGSFENDDGVTVSVKPANIVDADTYNSAEYFVITLEGDKAGNYSVSGINGEYTVTRAPAYVKIDFTVYYGDSIDGVQISLGTVKTENSSAEVRFTYTDSNNVSLNIAGLSGDSVGYTIENGKVKYTGGIASTNYTFENLDGEIYYKALPVTVTVSDAEFAYNTTITLDKTVSTTVKNAAGTDFVIGNLANEITLSYSSANPLPVGIYDITCEAAEGSNFDITYTTAKLTVTFDENLLSVTTAANLEYNGNPQALLTATIAEGVISPAYTLSYRVTKGATVSGWSSACTAVNAGTYTVEFRLDIVGFEQPIVLQKTSEVKVEASKNKYPDENYTFNFGLTQTVYGEYNDVLAGDAAWTYGNYTANFTVPQGSFPGNITYKLHLVEDQPATTALTDDEGITSTDIVKLFAENTLEVGVYKLQIITADDTQGNYTGTTYEYYFKVDKATITVSANDYKFTYGDNPENIVLTYSVTGISEEAFDALGVTIGFTGYEDLTSTTGAGTELTISVSVPTTFNNKNYEIKASDETATLTVVPRAITVRINSISVDYGSDTSGIDLYTFASVVGDSTLQLKDIITLSTQAISGNTTNNAGTYDINYTPKNNNYEVTVIAGKFTVDKLIVRVDWQGSKDFVYNADLIEVVASITQYIDSNGVARDLPAEVTEDDLVYSYMASGSTAEPTEGRPKDAGQYQIFVKFKDGSFENYSTSGANITVHIAKAVLNLNAENISMTYGEDEVQAKFTPILDAGEAIVGTDGEKAAIAGLADGITLKQLTINGTLYNELNKLNANTYIVSFDLNNDEDFKNYAVRCSSATLTVEKREVTVSVGTDNKVTVEYGGQEQGASVLTGKASEYLNITEGSLVNDDENSALGITLSALSAINVGTYKISAVSNSTNYDVTIANADNLTLEITAKALTLTVSAEKTYGDDDTQFKLNTAWIGFIDEESLEDLILKSKTDSLPYVSGEPEFKIEDGKLQRVEGTGYTFLNYTVDYDIYETVTINRRPVSLSLTEFNREYNGQDALYELQNELQFINALESDDLQATYQATCLEDGESVSRIENAGTYKVTVKLNNDNYILEENYTVTIVISKKVLTVSMDSALLASTNTLKVNYINGIDSNELKLGEGVAFGIQRTYNSFVDGEITEVTDNTDVSVMVSDGIGETRYGVHSDKYGTYTVKITLKNQKNYSFKDDEYETELSFSVYTSAVDVKIELKNGGNKEKVYDGSAYSISDNLTVTVNGVSAATGTDLSGAITYAYALKDSNVFDETAPVDAGKYVLRVLYFRNTANGAEGGLNTFEFEITKKPIDLSNLENPAHVEYKGTQTVDVSLSGYDWQGLAASIDRGSVVIENGKLIATVNDKGTYTITFSAANTNYTVVSENSLTITVDKATIKLDINKEISSVFNGANVNLAEKVTAKLGKDEVSFDYDLSFAYYVYTSDNAEDYEEATNITALKNVGTYFVIVTIEGTDNYEGATAYTKVTIQPKTVEVTATATAAYGGKTLGNLAFTYSGFVGDDDESLVSTANTEVEWIKNDCPVGSHKDAFTVTGFGYALDNRNYVFEFVSGTVEITPLSITVYIGNLDVPYGTDPEEVEGFTVYTLDILPDEYSDLADLLNFQFSLIDVTQSSDAGTYRIFGSATNGNYALNLVPGIYTIKPITVSVTLNENMGGTYGSVTAAEVVGVTSEDNPDLDLELIKDKITYLYTGTDNSGEEYNSFTAPVNAGSYIVTLGIDGDSVRNLAFDRNISVRFNIAKMTVDGSDIALGGSLTYTGNELRPVLVGTEGIEDLFTITTSGSVLDAGEYTMTLTLKDTDNMQWKTDSASAWMTGLESMRMTFTVAKAANGVSSLTIQGWTYGDEPNAPEMKMIHEVEYVYEYSDGTGRAWTEDVPVNAGTYYLRVRLFGTDNFAESVSGSYTFTIAKKELSIPTIKVVSEGNGKNDVYTGGTLLASVLGYDSEVMTLTFSNNVIFEGNSVALSAINAGTYKLSITLTNGNYVWADQEALDADGNITLSWKIEPKKVAKPAPNDGEYRVTGGILEYLPVGFDPAIMGITGNEEGHYGTFPVTVYLLDTTNYVWEDGTTKEISFDWTIVGISGVSIGLIVGLSCAFAIGIAAIAAQVIIHFRKRKKASAGLVQEDPVPGSDAGSAEEQTATEDGAGKEE